MGNLQGKLSKELLGFDFQTIREEKEHFGILPKDIFFHATDHYRRSVLVQGITGSPGVHVLEVTEGDHRSRLKNMSISDNSCGGTSHESSSRKKIENFAVYPPGLLHLPEDGTGLFGDKVGKNENQELLPHQLFRDHVSF
jgi:hypothetical protein